MTDRPPSKVPPDTLRHLADVAALPAVPRWLQAGRDIDIARNMGLTDALAHARQAAAPLSALIQDLQRNQLGLAGMAAGIDRVTGRAAMAKVLRDLAPHKAPIDAERFARAMGLPTENDALRAKLLLGDVGRSRIGEALLEGERLAALASRITLPHPLLPTDQMLLTQKLAGVAHLDWMKRAEPLGLFTAASAVSDLVGAHRRVTDEITAAARAFATMPLAGLGLTDVRQLLDGAGLVLPHWPRPRLLTRADKRRRFRQRLHVNGPPPHVRKATSLVHRYERTLREIIDDVMSTAYGESWAEERLPICDCKSLLGRWKKRGGFVLDHADYYDYLMIMCHPQHFAEVFAAGFDDADALGLLIKKAGDLRAPAHHARAFTEEDLRELRTTWILLETGLAALEGDYDFLDGD